MMNACSLRVVCRQVALWGVLVGAVVLLTLLFTVLGTITGAVLTGMMMASVGHRRWQTIPVSLVFPGVVVAMIHLAEVELAGARRVVLPVLCFGAFWLSYGMTRLLARYERRAGGASPAPAPGAGLAADRMPHEEPPPATRAEPTPLPAQTADLALEALQGQWRRAAGGADGEEGQRILEIVGTRARLRVIDSRGDARLVGEAELTLRSRQPMPLGSATGEVSSPASVPLPPEASSTRA